MNKLTISKKIEIIKEIKKVLEPSLKIP